MGEGEGGADAAGLPYNIYSRRVCLGEGGGKGEREQTRPCTRCSLHACSLTLCLSFSCLRSAVEASFDTRKAHGKPYTSFLSDRKVWPSKKVINQILKHVHKTCEVKIL
jgi:hypothetical protein